MGAKFIEIVHSCDSCKELRNSLQEHLGTVLNTDINLTIGILSWDSDALGLDIHPSIAVSPENEETSTNPMEYSTKKPQNTNKFENSILKSVNIFTTEPQGNVKTEQSVLNLIPFTTSSKHDNLYRDSVFNGLSPPLVEIPVNDVATHAQAAYVPKPDDDGFCVTKKKASLVSSYSASNDPSPPKRRRKAVVIEPVVKRIVSQIVDSLKKKETRDKSRINNNTAAIVSTTAAVVSTTAAVVSTTAAVVSTTAVVVSTTAAVAKTASTTITGDKKLKGECSRTSPTAVQSPAALATTVNKEHEATKLTRKDIKHNEDTPSLASSTASSTCHIEPQKSATNSKRKRKRSRVTSPRDKVNASQKVSGIIANERPIRNCKRVKPVTSQSVAGDVMFDCRFCSKSFPKKIEWTKHEWSTHRDGRKFICTLCPFTTSKSTLLIPHIQKHDAVPRFCCEICGEQFRVEKLMKRHVLEHTSPRQRKHPCTICHKSFFENYQLMGHTRNVHEKNFTQLCPHCGFRPTTPFALKVHIVSAHTTEKNAKCKYCDYACKLESNLSLHVRKHHPQYHNERVYYNCPHCSYSTDVKFSLVYHLKYHDNEPVESQAVLDTDNDGNDETAVQTQLAVIENNGSELTRIHTHQTNTVTQLTQ